MLTDQDIREIQKVQRNKTIWVCITIMVCCFFMCTMGALLMGTLIHQMEPPSAQLDQGATASPTPIPYSL